MFTCHRASRHIEANQASRIKRHLSLALVLEREWSVIFNLLPSE